MATFRKFDPWTYDASRAAGQTFATFAAFAAPGLRAPNLTEPSAGGSGGDRAAAKTVSDLPEGAAEPNEVAGTEAMPGGCMKPVSNGAADRAPKLTDAATGPAKVANVAKVESADEVAAIEERAAIVQFDGGAPMEWAEGLARLDGSKPPGGMTQRRWQQVLDDAGRFLDEWGKAARELGWSAADLLGVHAQALDARVDLQGLVWLLEGRFVVAITAETAVLEGRADARLTYRRKPMSGPVAIWDLVP